MKVEVEFLCDKCGLLTPGIAEIPNDTHYKQKVRLGHTCFHCDAPLEMIAQAGKLLSREALRIAREAAKEESQ